MSGGRRIKIIADEYVDREFGTGALKITPGEAWVCECVVVVVAVGILKGTVCVFLYVAVDWEDVVGCSWSRLAWAGWSGLLPCAAFGLGASDLATRSYDGGQPALHLASGAPTGTRPARLAGHDVNDYEIGKRFSLEIINIMNDDGTLNAAAGAYAGLDRFAGGRAGSAAPPAARAAQRLCLPACPPARQPARQPALQVAEAPRPRPPCTLALRCSAQAAVGRHGSAGPGAQAGALPGKWRAQRAAGCAGVVSLLARTGRTFPRQYRLGRPLTLICSPEAAAWGPRCLNPPLACSAARGFLPRPGAVPGPSAPCAGPQRDAACPSPPLARAQMRVPRSQRGGEIVEPLVREQWFVRMEPLAKPALEVGWVDGRAFVHPLSGCSWLWACFGARGHSACRAAPDGGGSLVTMYR